MATLQKFKILDEQEQVYKRTGKIDELAIQQAGITPLDYQQYEAVKRELQKTGQIDFTKYTSDPVIGTYGGVDTNQFDKDALDLMRTAWKDSYTTSADKGKAYDMSDPDDVQNMLSGRMSKAVSSTYDIDEMNQWLYREGLPNSQYFGAMYNAALESIAETRQHQSKEKELDDAISALLLEKSRNGEILDEQTIDQSIGEVLQSSPEYEKSLKALYPEDDPIAIKRERFSAEAEPLNQQAEEAAQKAAQEARENSFFGKAFSGDNILAALSPASRGGAEEPEQPLVEADPKAQEIVEPFKLPELELTPFNIKDASPEEKRQAAEARERRELERSGRSQEDIDAHITSLSEEDWARRIGRMEAAGYGDENVLESQQEEAYQEKKREAATGAYNALRDAGYSAADASFLLEQNGFNYADTEIYREAEAQRRTEQEEGIAYLNQRMEEDGMTAAAIQMHTWESNAGRYDELNPEGAKWADKEAEYYAWGQAARQELITNLGLSPLAADNVMAVSNLEKVLDKRQTAEDYERYILSVYGLDDEQIETYISNMTEEEWEKRISDLKFNDMLETGGYEQAERSLLAIPIRAALGIATGAVGVTDMVVNGAAELFTGEEKDMWGATKWLMNQSGKWAAYAHDVNHSVMSMASDMGSEILRMYALGYAGKALGGLTAAGTSKLLSTAASQAPFVSSAMGNYYTQARAGGASQSEATLYGMTAGAVEGLLESTAMSEILNQAFTNKIMTKAITNAATPLKTRMLLAKYGTPLASIFASTIGEFGEEAASEVISGLLRTSIWDSSYETQPEDVGASGAMGAAIGFIMAALGAPATSHRNQIAMQMMDAQSGAMPMDLQMFGEMYDNLVAATITESLKPETLTLVQKDAALQSAPTVADMIAQIQQDNAHISAESVRHKRRLEALTEDVEKARSKVNRYVTAFKKLDPNSPDYATRWGELRGQIDTARDNFEQITASSLSKREAAAEEHAALVSRLQNDVARTSDKLTRHFVARDAAARAEQPAEPIEAGISVEPPETGTPVAQPADVAQPITDLGANVPTEADLGVSRAYTNTFSKVLEAEGVEITDGMQEDAAYAVQHNTQSMEKAQAMLDELGVDGTAQQLIQNAENGIAWDGEHGFAAMGVMSEMLQASKESGDTEALRDWLLLMREQITPAAQLMQSLNGFMKAGTIEGYLFEAQKNVANAEKSAAPKTKQAIDTETADIAKAVAAGEDVEAAIKKTMRNKKPKTKESVIAEIQRMLSEGIYSEKRLREVVKDANGLPVLTDADIQSIIGYMDVFDTATDDRARKEAAYRASAIVASKLGEGTGTEKIRALSYMNMLLHIRTGIKNFAANAPMLILETIKDIPGTFVDMAVAKKTGQRTTTAFSAERYKIIPSSGWKGLKDAALDLAHDVQTSPMPGRVENVRRNVFKSKTLNRAERLVGQWMNLGDRAWFQIAYDGRIAELAALGHDVNTPKAIESAELYALDRVFQNNSKLAQRAIGVRDKLGVVGDLVLPFAQTPANIADKLMDYSPIGMARAIKQWGTEAGTTDFNQKLFVDRVSRSMTGTGLMLLGAALAAKGIITGAARNKKEREMLRNAGVEEYALRLDDTYHTINWAEPAMSLMIIGAVLYDALGKDGSLREMSLSEATLESAVLSINALFDNTFLSSIADLFNSDSPGDALANLAITSTSRMTPALAGAAARTIDPMERDTYDPNPFIRQGKYILSRIPGLRQLLPEKIATDGTVQEAEGPRFVQNFLNPGYSSTLTDDPVNAEIYRLYEEGFSGHLLPEAEKNIDGIGRLSAEQRRELQEMYGESTYAAAQSAMDSTRYQYEDDEGKAALIHDAVSDAKRQTLKDFKVINGAK